MVHLNAIRKLEKINYSLCEQVDIVDRRVSILLHTLSLTNERFQKLQTKFDINKFANADCLKSVPVSHNTQYFCIISRFVLKLNFALCSLCHQPGALVK